ncbi:MAG: pentapeptide repeat-containing protein [Caldilineaceae bacterium]|nr:pentapeptide repeat-containing protein [Caldilineaceae bacterium]
MSHSPPVPLTLRLNLFGPFRATWENSAALDLRLEKAEVLLAWLALEARHPVPRTHLAGLLWEGYLPASALQSLRTLLYRVRQQIEPADLLQVTNRTVSFNSANPHIWCDALQFDQLMAHLEQTLTVGGPLSSAQRHQAATALDLYSGEFLTGLTLDDSPTLAQWLAERRGHYQRQVERLRAALQQAAPPAVGMESTGPQIDWGEIPSPVHLHGRQAEVAQIKRWLTVDRAQLIGVYGIGGQGKTALAAEAVRELAQASPFQRIIWRSLLNAPALDEILLDWTLFLSDWQIPALPPTLDRKLALLVKLLGRSPTLLVLDNLESVMETGAKVGRFRPGYEGYAQLLSRLAQSEHQGSLLITSREQPLVVEQMAQVRPKVQTLLLGGLSPAAGMAVLRQQALQGGEEKLSLLASRYSGNPLALLLAARLVQDLFTGDADSFLAQETLIFDDIRDVLADHLRRLSPLELDLLLWLAVEREPVSIQSLQANLTAQIPHTTILETLRALRRHLLVESISGLESALPLFGLQNVVLEYLTDWLVEQICQELEVGAFHFLRSLVLMKAHTREYVRQSQIRLILEPVVARLRNLWGREKVGGRLQSLLAPLRDQDPLRTGYAATNLLHLWLIAQERVENADLSHLSLPGAYLRNLHLPGADLTGSDLRGALFTDAMEGIRSLATDGGDRWIAAGAENGLIWIWRKADQSLHQTIQTPTSVISALAFNPGGDLLAAAGVNGSLTLWSVAGGRLHKQLQPVGSEIKALAYHPSGEWLASGARDGTITLWQTMRGTAAHHLPAQAESALHLLFDSDGSRLICVYANGQIVVWDWQQRQILHSWRVVTGGRIPRLSLHPNGRWLAGALTEGAVSVWDCESGAQVHYLPTPEQIYDVAISPDGGLVVGASHDGLIYVWAMESGQRVNLLVGHHHRVACVAFCADGRTLISCGADHSLRAWELPSGRVLYQLSGYRRSIATLAVHPAGNLLAMAGNDLTVRLWDTEGWQIVRQWPAHERLITTCAFSADGQLLATGGSDRLIHLWEVASGQPLRSLEGHSQPVERVVFHPSRPLLASGGLDFSVRLWDVASGQQRHCLTDNSDWISDLAFSPDGRLLANAAGNQTLYIWQLDEGLNPAPAVRVPLVDAEYGTGLLLRFHPRSHLLACATDQSVCLLDVSSGQILHTFSGHRSWPLGLDFHPAGDLLASVGMERTLYLWDLETGQARWSRQVERQSYSLRFSADGEFLFSGRADGFLDIWAVASGEPVRTVRIPGPYAGMKISGVRGISAAQRASLTALGAIDD